MDSFHYLVIFIIVTLLFFIYIRCVCKVTLVSAAIMSLVIAILFVWLMDQVVPCNHRDNRENVEGLIILTYISFIFIILYVFYMGLQDKDECAINTLDRNIVFC